MARPYYTCKHVPTASALPEKLTIGRVYYVDDEGYIVIDHGDGPKIYGYRIGPAGRPGEPLPELQHQIDSLTRAAFRNAFNELESDEHTRNVLSHEVKERILADKDLFRQVNYLSEAVMNLALFMSVLDENMRGTEAAITKLITEVQPILEPITPEVTPEVYEAFILHLIMDATDADGIGDTFEYGGRIWDVTEQGDGTYNLTLRT